VYAGQRRKLTLLPPSLPPYLPTHEKGLRQRLYQDAIHTHGQGEEEVKGGNEAKEEEEQVACQKDGDRFWWKGGREGGREGKGGRIGMTKK